MQPKKKPWKKEVIETEEEKRIERKNRNRVCAATARKKRIERYKFLEDQNTIFFLEKNQLLAENMALKKQLADLEMLRKQNYELSNRLDEMILNDQATMDVALSEASSDALPLTPPLETNDDAEEETFTLYFGDCNWIP
jgi:hypothetical protein